MAGWIGDRSQEICLAMLAGTGMPFGVFPRIGGSLPSSALLSKAAGAVALVASAQMGASGGRRGDGTDRTKLRE
jgi:hypothetical protein